MKPRLFGGEPLYLPRYKNCSLTGSRLVESNMFADTDNVSSESLSMKSKSEKIKVFFGSKPIWMGHLALRTTQEDRDWIYSRK